MTIAHHEKNKEKPKTKRLAPSVITPIVLLSILFFFGQYAYQMYRHAPILMQAEIYEFFSQEIAHSGTLVLSILYFLLVQTGIIAGYILITYFIVRGVALVFNWTKRQMRSWGIFFWLLFTISLWMANQYFYPQSDFSLLTDKFQALNLSLTHQQINYITIGFFISCGLIIVLALIGFFIWISRHLVKSVILFIVMVAAGYAYYQKNHPTESFLQDKDNNRPNVVLINLDSLQPQLLKLFNSSNNQLTYLNNYLYSSTVFTKNITPSNQSMPVWISILSGQYPSENGYDENYLKIPKSIINDNIIKIAKNKGYYTGYVSDSSRSVKFRGLNSFDTISAPPDNFTNLLLGESNDLIVSNLITNTPIGPYLFPASFGNRDILETFEPNTLIRRLNQVLDKKQNQPIFLTINMSLAKWPYGWRNTPSAIVNNSYSYYINAINTLDKQFNAIMAILEERSILNNSIVIIFSTNGEYFRDIDKRLITQENYIGNQNIKQILNTIEQNDWLTTAFHTLLSIRIYDSKENNQGKVINEVTSLTDIYATLAEHLGIDTSKTSSQSLLPLVLGKTTPLSRMPIFFESSLQIDRLSLRNSNLLRYLKNGLDNFSINCSNGSIELKPAAKTKLEPSKLIGQVNYPNIILSLPGSLGYKGEIVYNLDTKTWTLINSSEPVVPEDNEYSM